MDILLKNGLVYDGTRQKPRILDVHVKDGLIQGIGEHIDVQADQIIDCKGLKVSPGWIDAHSHNDFFVTKSYHVDATLPFIKQGITTQIVGNCGFSAYGVGEDSEHKDHIGGGLFKVENPKPLTQYMKEVEGKLLVNIACLIGHGTTRMSVTGKSSKPQTDKEIAKQVGLVEEAMQAGAFGGSFGLMYQPGMFASKNELVAFAKAIARHDGILTVHPRANSKIALGYPLIGKPHIEQGLDEVVDIVKETNVRCEYSHLIFVGKASWKCVDRMVKKFKETRKLGYEIAYDIYPFTYGASVITVVLPSWYLKLSLEDKYKKWNRFKLRMIINITKKLLGIEFADMVISYIGPDYPQYEGKTITQLAKEENIDPFDMYLRLVDLSKGRGRMMLGKYYNEEIIAQLMKDDLSIYMTDAWYEESGTQNAGTYQAFPLFILKSNELKIPLEDTIHKMTGATCDRFKIDHRGYLKVGYAADITVFNDDKMQVSYEQPDMTPPGIEMVMVNGQIVYSNQHYHQVKSGVVLKKAPVILE